MMVNTNKLNLKCAGNETALLAQAFLVEYTFPLCVTQVCRTRISLM